MAILPTAMIIAETKLIHIIWPTGALEPPPVLPNSADA